MAKKKKTAFPILPLAVLIIIIAASLLLIFGSNSPDFDQDGHLRLCIDPGHGGSDSGALGSDGERQEKDDCLEAAILLKDHVSSLYPEVEVLLTRQNDSEVSLEERCALANDFSSDLFVSIHRNSAGSAAQGVEIWISSDTDRTSRKMASELLTALGSVGISSDRGVKKGTASNSEKDYYVNKNTNMPSCLIELGFITSDEDNSLFDRNLDDYMKQAAKVLGDMLTA